MLGETAKENPQEGFEHSHNRGEDNAAEARESGSRSRSDGFSLELHDLRTATAQAETAKAETAHAQAAESLAARAQGSSAADITMELRMPDFNPVQSAQTAWEARPQGSASVLENMLARELHNNFNGDIVRHASMALKNGGESIVRLNLLPDTLGNVKIHLEMSENKIAGIILVESEEALNAFKQEINALEQAFKESGFADANLDLSLASDGKNAWQENENISNMHLAASTYEDSLRDAGEPTDVIEVFGRNAGTLNVLA